MKTLVLIFGVITNDGQIELVKVPNIELKNINSCEKAIEINRKWVDNPDFEKNDMPWGFYTYKNRPIMLQYCVLKGVEHE
tara:strand:+ start:618 stop:857 length:240 start_codon:yes stop_codon:yes gene_type:complete